MRVHELLEILKTYDPRILVLVSGYEDGYDNLDAESIKIVTVVDSKQEDYNGRFGDWNEHDDSGYRKITAVLLPR